MPPKRKRGSTMTSTEPPAIEIAQPSSRDASEEDIEDLILQDVTKRRNEDASDKNPAPAKRARSSAATTATSKSEDDDDSDDEMDGEMNGKSLEERRAIEDRIERGEGGERGQMRMEDPPPAGQVDPVGYHTNPPPTGRPVRIYADGVFDLFHLGHMRQLQQAKTAFPEVHLIVGVTGDKETHRRKGLTVLSGKERAESVRHCKWVDEVIEDCPWIIADAPEFIEKHKIDYVAHDDIPYGAEEGDDIYAPIKKAGKFLVTQRTEGVSTTGIITKIVRDYDKYITRQLKRGTPRQELNVSWLKKHELDIKRNVTELRENIRTNWSTTGQELSQELRRLWQGSRPASPARSPAPRAGDNDQATSPRLGITPSALAHLSHLELPKATSPNGAGSSDFAAGYSLGLLGGVRSWMARSRRTLNDSRAGSDDSGDDSPLDRSPPADVLRGRKGKPEMEL